MEFFFALLLFIAFIVIIAVIFYNKIIQLKVRVNEGWSDIQVQLKRRHDLIGNLVETVKGYATHEKETLNQVIQARNAAKEKEGSTPQDVQSAERQLSNAMQGLKINALAEAYPDLKANTNFLELQRELSDTENKIAASRRFYNTTVQALNTYIQQIPGKFFAGMAKATPAEFFEVEEDQQVKEVPQVNFQASAAEKASTPAAKPANATPVPPVPQTPPAPQSQQTQAPQTTAPAQSEMKEQKEEAPSTPAEENAQEEKEVNPPQAAPAPATEQPKAPEEKPAEGSEEKKSE